ncbi:phosphonate ABC transporter ATP-binding protein [Paenibacillus sp. FSL R7-0273]|uniref:phosphonate ABC transporter ATP-binding protein n=1 Tax=Paenibacillus sp. FSL R7-0273 TaxID=1536772 RepID=UPI0004F68242|nr:phosphonate ABC transporter ATP-binding protein [Paenibacillus sp. FSL R7-0273]AIQ45823.1 phosphonate ABC transporter ATP-binding protein [Paenibacillus sp. FSL R7-0273]OMF95351.1 phosphonate ABC transporter ATP-binding protein [Paenibacillus sp. FSL R7-0273]
MIQFIDVNKTYNNGTTALSNINLTIGQGEFVAVIGLSGAGKSTLIRCINRIHDISGGQLLVDEVDVSKLRGRHIRRFRRRIGMIFQSFNLVTRTSVMNNVLVSFVPGLPWWRKLTGIFRKEHKILALEALDKVGILDKAFVRVDQLSGGQQQRVALARTLAQNPDIILADEPIASLDPVTARIVMDDFKKINQEMNISVIMNIHHVEIALEYADRIIGIRKGEVVFDGATSGVTQEILQEIYGGKWEAEKAAMEEQPAYV